MIVRTCVRHRIVSIVGRRRGLAVPGEPLPEHNFRRGIPRPPVFTGHALRDICRPPQSAAEQLQPPQLNWRLLAPSQPLTSPATRPHFSQARPSPAASGDSAAAAKAAAAGAGAGAGAGTAAAGASSAKDKGRTHRLRHSAAADTSSAADTVRQAFLLQQQQQQQHQQQQQLQRQQLQLQQLQHLQRMQHLQQLQQLQQQRQQQRQHPPSTNSGVVSPTLTQRPAWRACAAPAALPGGTTAVDTPATASGSVGASPTDRDQVGGDDADFDDDDDGASSEDSGVVRSLLRLRHGSLSARPV